MIEVNHSEKFPIYWNGTYYAVESFRYRNARGNNVPSVHSRAAAININAHYNDQGSSALYTPGENDFCITPNGSVCNIFYAHGWYWGGYFKGSRFGPMHFTLVEETD